MKAGSVTSASGRFYAIAVFAGYCTLAVLVSIISGGPIPGGEYSVNWTGVISVLVLSGILTNAYVKLPDHADIKQSLYFVLIVMAIAMVIVVIGVSIHVNGPVTSSSGVEVHPSETVSGLLLMLNVTEGNRPSLSMIIAHTLVVSSIAAAIIQKKGAGSGKKVRDFT